MVRYVLLLVTTIHQMPWVGRRWFLVFALVLVQACFSFDLITIDKMHFYAMNIY